MGCAIKLTQVEFLRFTRSFQRHTESQQSLAKLKPAPYIMWRKNSHINFLYTPLNIQLSCSIFSREHAVDRDGTGQFYRSEADSKGYLEVVAVKFDVLSGQCVFNAKAVVVVVVECIHRGILQLVLVDGI